MFETIFPGLGAWFEAFSSRADQWFWIVAAGIVTYGGWRSHWRNRYARRMRQMFEQTNLFVKPRKERLFPELMSLSNKEDELYYVFRYRLQPGMSVPQFEEKKKIFESAFHAETRVFGKGGIVTIKVKKQKYPIPTTEQSA